MANKAGFDMKITSCEVLTCIADSSKGDYDVELFSFGGKSDPDQNISPVLSSTGSSFVTGLVDPKVDQLLAQARRTVGDEQVRAALYAQALDAARDDSGVIFLLNQGTSIAYRKSVSDVGYGPAQISNIAFAALS
jgi:peptide/nickel transport system substrate-binding protein